MRIIGVPGITDRPNRYGAFDLPAAHVFRIRNGSIYEIEAIGYMARHGIKNGWHAPRGKAPVHPAESPRVGPLVPELPP